MNTRRRAPNHQSRHRQKVAGAGRSRFSLRQSHDRQSHDRQGVGRSLTLSALLVMLP